MSGKKDLSGSTIIEDTGTINIYRDTDVLVVGGGPAGTGAALAAARNGAGTILLERFGYLGGLATGGFVLCIMPMSDGTNEQQIAGICQEIIDRLDDIRAAVHPRKEDLGSNDKKLNIYWLKRGSCWANPLLTSIIKKRNVMLSFFISSINRTKRMN